MIAKRHDTRVLKWRVIDAETGDIQNLTGSTCKLLVRRQYDYSDGTIVLPLTIDGDPLQGIVAYHPDGSLAEGIYDIEVETTGPDDTVTTSPTDGYNVLQIDPDLG